MSKNKIDTYYIYILQNSANKIKIGRTTNFEQRLTSLSGSNGGGETIIDYYCSPPTYLHTLERVMHDKFAKYRIPNTEWFQGVEFSEVVDELKNIINSEEYKRCNELREKLNEMRKE